MPKKFNRRKHFSAPQAVDRCSYIRTTDYASESTVFYGIITKFIGGKKCNVMIVDPQGKTECLKNVRLKGSLQNMRCKQYLNPDSTVLIDDGTIVIVYTRESEHVIPEKYLSILRNHDDHLAASNDFNTYEEEKYVEQMAEQESDDDDDLDCI